MSVLTSVGNIVLSKPKYTIAGIIAANMVCRPIITMSNKEVPEDTRKYAASREFCTEFFGMINLFTIATLFEYIGGQRVSKKLTGKVLNRETFKRINEQAMELLKNPIDKQIKKGILIASFIGSVISSAVVTPMLNNLVLNKLMNKIGGKKDDKSKLPETTSVNLPQNSGKDENIFNKYNKIVQAKNNK
jgi:hypothetical protein